MSRQVPEPPEYLVITATVFYIIVFILGVFGNILVIVVILANKNMVGGIHMTITNKSATHKFIRNIFTVLFIFLLANITTITRIFPNTPRMNTII
jgi:hypothetical protein